MDRGAWQTIQFMRSQRVRYEGATNTFTFIRQRYKHAILLCFILTSPSSASVGGRETDGHSSRACGEPWCSVGPPHAGGDVSGASVCLGSLQGHTDELWGLAVHASKPQFLTCGHDRHATLWDAVGHRPVWDKVIEVGLRVLVRLSYKNASATHRFIYLFFA